MNYGSVNGAEIAKVTLPIKMHSFPIPKKASRFEKVYSLKQAKEKRIIRRLPESVRVLQRKLGDWMVETGEFDILVGSSSRDIKLTAYHDR